jgi:hypothetical protein
MMSETGETGGHEPETVSPEAVGAAAVAGTVLVEADGDAEGEPMARAISGVDYRIVQRKHGVMVVYSPPLITKEESVEFRLRQATADITDPAEKVRVESILRPIFMEEG